MKFEFKYIKSNNPNIYYRLELINLRYINSNQIISINLTLFNLFFKIYKEKH